MDLDITGPILDVSGTAFSFTASESGANPADQALTVSNTGSGTVNWSIDTTGEPNWLTITPTSGSLTNGTNEPVTLSVDITGLSAGSYSYAFDVSDPAAQNSPQTVTVDLDITGPILDVSG
ncbi:MAG: BACON domain-containing protein, partial [Planctomycetota bacterium]